MGSITTLEWSAWLLSEATSSFPMCTTQGSPHTDLHATPPPLQIILMSTVTAILAVLVMTAVSRHAKLAWARRSGRQTQLTATSEFATDLQHCSQAEDRLNARCTAPETSTVSSHHLSVATAFFHVLLYLQRTYEVTPVLSPALLSSLQVDHQFFLLTTQQLHYLPRVHNLNTVVCSCQ